MGTHNVRPPLHDAKAHLVRDHELLTHETDNILAFPKGTSEPQKEAKLDAAEISNMQSASAFVWSDYRMICFEKPATRSTTLGRGRGKGAGLIRITRGLILRPICE